MCCIGYYGHSHLVFKIEIEIVALKIELRKERFKKSEPSYNKKALKCKHSANCACAVPLIDGLGWAISMRLLAVTRLYLAESLTRAATAVDSMLELMQTLCCDFLFLQDTQSQLTA